MKMRNLLILCVSVALAVPAAAHDSWLVPRGGVASDGKITVAFVTGEVFPKSDAATKPDRVDSWQMIVGSGRSDVREFGVEKDELRAHVRPAGAALIAVRLKPNFIEIAPEKFEKYLNDEGATPALKMRGALHESRRPGRESYSKLAKTYVPGNSGGDSTFAARFDHVLEIVLLSDPTYADPNEPYEFEVLLRGKPAPGLRVHTGYEGLPEHAYAETVTTDADGRARVRISRPGLWFINTHVIERAAAGRKHDWESWWASYTFRVEAKPSTK